MTASPSFNPAAAKRDPAPKLGRYELGPRLASGGAGSVYLARLAGIDDFERLYAVKCIHEYLRDEPGFVEMFLEEARLAARLSHPNVVQVYELAQDGDVLFMAMEYLHAESLAAILRSAAEQNVRIGYDVAAWVMARVAEGLHHAHQVKDKRGQPVGLVHRDVSPQNILVTYDGQVKLIDFGIARAEGRVVKTQQGKIKGKLMYMAPEQALGMDVDHRADQFALGATLFELATGERLFPGEEGADIMRKVIAGEIRLPSAVCDDFPVKLEKIILRTLERDRKKRYDSSGAVSRELDEFAGLGRQVDLCERLAHLVSDLCADSRESREHAIRELKERAPSVETPSRPDVRPKPLDPPTQLDMAAGTATALDSFIVQPTELALTRPDHEAQTSVISPDAIRASATNTPLPEPTRPKRAIMPWAAGIVAATLLMLGLLIWGGVRLFSKPATVPVERIALDVTIVPAVAGTITVRDRKTQGATAHVELEPSKQPLDVSVEAEGYSPARVSVVPDKNQMIVVRLTPEPPPPASPEPAAELPEAEVGEPVDPVAPPPAPATTGARKSRKVAKPGKTTSPKSDVIEKNPF